MMKVSVYVDVHMQNIFHSNLSPTSFEEQVIWWKSTTKELLTLRTFPIILSAQDTA